MDMRNSFIKTACEILEMVLKTMSKICQRVIKYSSTTHQNEALTALGIFGFMTEKW